MKARLLPFNPLLVIDALPKPIILIPEIVPTTSSRPLTPLDSLIPILYKNALKTPGHVNNIQQILKLQRDS